MLFPSAIYSNASKRKQFTNSFWVMLLILFSGLACNQKNDKLPSKILFKTLYSESTQIDFANNLKYSNEFNIFKYMYFYNGSGVGAGDFNNDGRIDLFFGSNQGRNKLYLNQGEMKFKDITVEAALPDDAGWTTGISVVDINNDGLLDVYVCRVGQFETLKGQNLLLINKGIGKNGIPAFKDEAIDYGLNFSGFSTQAAFFDYDMDGDLDMYLLNHSIHENGTYKPRASFLNTYHPLSGDRLYKNNHGKFIDATKESGIQSYAIGYGLGVVITDINLDGYPDIYIGNDFHENDYLYINQKNGTFIDEGQSNMMHTSQYTMGVDAADINNDGWPEIISMDMLPYDKYVLKRSFGEAEYDVFNFKLSYGYGYQYSRNNLQLNRRNGFFSETGLYCGIEATDWSWAPLWVDFDNDGRKDLFVSNGIPKRLNDIDYVSFIAGSEIQRSINNNSVEEKDLALINKFPQIKIPNKFFLNKPDLRFEDEEARIADAIGTYSNGAAYADLDNDGDLDIVVNNIDAAAMIYRNESSNQFVNESVTIKLTGSKENINALGAKIFAFAENEIRVYEKSPVRGFISSMEFPLQIGIKDTKIDSAILLWPNNRFQMITVNEQTNLLNIKYSDSLPIFDLNRIKNFYKSKSEEWVDVTTATRLNYCHKENALVDFYIEPLIPHMVSTEGPALAIADINKDGLEDVFVGSSKISKPAVFLQQANGTYNKIQQPALDKDSVNEEVSACWADINNDAAPDLIVANGGNEYYGHDKHLTPCLYVNDGKGNLSKQENTFDSLYVNASSVCAYDFNGDGYEDLFIAGRTVPWSYGKIPMSYLLQNNKNGRFTNVTNIFSPDLSQLGMLTSARWIDIDNDKDKDLLTTCEWGVVTAFINNNGKFLKKEITDKSGWWNFTLPVDVDNDGDLDIVAGNLGLNSRLKASKEQPVRLYYNDFDNNGKKEQLLTYYLNNNEIPFSGKEELQRQIPLIKKKYLYAEDFAKASLSQIFDNNKLKNAEVLLANYFPNVILINDGKMNFTIKEMPWPAQLTSFKAAQAVDVNEDKLPDILLMGNYYDNNIQLGRCDADFGTVLINKGSGNFDAETINGLTIKGQVRNIVKTKVKNKDVFILAMNNDSLRVITYK